MNGINDAVAIVTGASRGIGRAIAKRFGAEGARVVAADVSVEGGERTVESIVDDGGEAVFVETDVSDPEAVRAMVDTAIETYDDLDFAVNNAGIEGESEPSIDQPLDNWERVIDVNLAGVFFGMRHQIPAMLDRGGGVVVNVSSVAGVVGFPNLAPYVASKHGVNGLTKTAALEYSGEGIRVNAICPGIIETPMLERARREAPEVIEQTAAATPIGRLGEAEEVGDAVVWLCSDDASFVTGETLVVDGGYVAQ